MRRYYTFGGNMKIAIVGLGHAFKKQYAGLKSIKKFKEIELCDRDESKVKEYGCTNDYLELKSNHVIVATSPKSHLEIVSNLIKNGKKVILEKPIVTNLEELSKLKEIIKKENFYNSLHFAYGEEINYYMKFKDKIPKKIKAYISDAYVKDGHIIDSALGLCGSYLDEVINPLSAIARLFGYNIIFLSNEKKYYDGDEFDYYSKSKFKVNEIDTEIEVLWNERISQKYIDLYYENEVIRLDSMNQKVINLTSSEVLFEGQGDRMTNHYIGVFNDMLENGSNLDISIKLHEALLKGAKVEK